MRLKTSRSEFRGSKNRREPVIGIRSPGRAQKLYIVLIAIATAITIFLLLTADCLLPLPLPLVSQAHRNNSIF